MGTILFILAAVVLFCFGFVLLFGAPYVPTLDAQVAAALALSGLRPGQTMLELGCGDGKVLVAAARQGYKAVGYELNPIMAGIAWLRTIRYRGQVRVVCGDFWRVKWPESQAIFVFLLDRFMPRLDKTIEALPYRPLRLVSFAFQIPHKQPAAVENGIYMYEYK